MIFAVTQRGEPMDDLISRQAAIDAPVKMVSVGLDWIPMYHIKGLPSAQPEEDCDTCKHGYFGDDQCNNCRVRYPSHYERRTDE